MSAEAASASGLRALVVRGIGWKVVSQVSMQIWQMGVAIALARMLRPHDYGLAGMVLAASGLVIVFSNLALGTALIQRRTLSEDDRSTVFWIGTGAGVLFTAAGIALSGPLARFYGEPQVQALFAVFSLTFLLTALGMTQKALLTRDMNFKSLELRLMFSSVGGGAIGVAFAVAGYGAWAIIVQQLVVALLSTGLLWLVSPWRPRFVFSLASVRSLGRFSGTVFGQNLLYQLTRSGDNVLIGRFLGPAAVGAYTLSYNIMLIPLSRIVTPVTDVLFPALSRLQDEPDRVAAVWLRVNRLLASISVPSMLGLMVVAPDFVHVVLGDRWHAATPVIRILAWVGLLQAVQNLNGEVLLAIGRAGTFLRFTILWCVLSVGAVVVGLHWGIVGVAVCFAIANTILTPLIAWLTGSAVSVTLLGFARSLSDVFQAAGAMAVAVLAVRLGLLHTDVPAALRFAAEVLVGVGAYALLALWRLPDVVGELRRLRAGSR